MVYSQGEIPTTYSREAFTMKLITTIAAATTFAFAATPAQADYKYKVDRFTGRQTASYTQEGAGCKQTEGIKGKANACLFMNSTENKRYPIIGVMKVNEGWELLHTARRKGNAPAIITLTNGKVIRKTIPASLDTSTLHGGIVSEWVNLRFGGTGVPVNQMRKIEVQYGSAEFEIIPNRKAICALKRAKTCG